MRFIFLSVMLLAIVFLSGCNEEQIARAEVAVQQARQLLDDAEQKKSEAYIALAAAKELAQKMDSKEGQILVAQCEAAADGAAALLPVARESLRVASAAVIAAKESQQSGAKSWEIGLSVILSLLGGGGAAQALARGGANRATAALEIVGAFGKKAASVETDDEVRSAKIEAITNASRDQRLYKLVTQHI